MQSPFDNIVQHLFHQPSLHSVTVDEIENMAQQHPYFAAAHFLLLRKMQETDHPQFGTQLHKTTLYFNNPLWLQFLLQPETVANFEVSEKAPFISEEPATIPLAVAQNGNGHGYEHTVAAAWQQPEEHILPEKENEPAIIEEPVVQEQVPVHSNGGIMDVITEVFNEEPVHASHLSSAEETTSNKVTDTHAGETVNYKEAPENSIESIHEHTASAATGVASYEDNQIAAEETGAEPTHETFADANNAAIFHEESPMHLHEATAGNNVVGQTQPFVTGEENIATAAHEEIKHEEPAPEYNHYVADAQPENRTEEAIEASPVFANEEAMAPVVDTSAEAYTIVDEPSSAPVEEEVVVDAAPFNEDVTESVIATVEENNAAVNFQTEEAISEHTSAVIENATAQSADDTDKTEAANESIHEPGKPLLRTIIETPASKHDFLFEPYHTVDYFASQGIKLSKLEANSKDKLGRQLKSFTEWLKSMKKLPQASIDKILSENEESKVVADANHSIEKKDVITEAMAEVFEKQGMRNEAAGLYQKLSLLNPAKSAYFAAKIEALKH